MQNPKAAKLGTPAGAEMPHYLARLPRDKRGFPITATVLQYTDGTVDFTSTNPLAWEIAIATRSCGMCGIVLKERVWFIGGPRCMEYRFFFDLPMHEECGRYALKVCPYLALRRYMGAKTRPTPDSVRVPLVSSNSIKPRYFGFAYTNGFRLEHFQGDRLVKADPWEGPIEWWLDGQVLAEAPAPV